MTFNIRQSVFDRDGEIREEAADRYRDQLMELFAASPEAEALGAEDFPFGWAATLIDYGISYLGETPATMTPADLHELLLDIFPRKVMAERGCGEEIVRELRAFWAFLRRQFQLPNATACLEMLDDAMARRVEKEMHNRSRFGMAKSLLSLGKLRGFDIGSPEGIESWLTTYNQEQVDDLMAEPDEPPGPPSPFLDALPGHGRQVRKKKIEHSRRRMAKESQRRNRRKR